MYALKTSFDSVPRYASLKRRIDNVQHVNRERDGGTRPTGSQWDKGETVRERLALSFLAGDGAVFRYFAWRRFWWWWSWGKKWSANLSAHFLDKFNPPRRSANNNARAAIGCVIT